MNTSQSPKTDPRRNVRSHGIAENGTRAAAPGLIVSLDFELRWGVRDLPTVDTYRSRLLAVREAIPATLGLFRKYDIHATWATVGMLLFDSKRDLLRNLPDVRPTYDNVRLSPYEDLSAIGSDEQSDPLHFGRSLAAEICETPGQEIGSHTFSHYYCLEPGQTADQFRADITCSIDVTRAFCGQSPRSIVFPRNQCSPKHIEVCRSSGIDVYRGTEPHWAYRADAGQGFNTLPKRITRLADAFLPITGSQQVSACRELGREGHEGVWNVPSSRFFRPRFQALGVVERMRIHRIATAMRASIAGGNGFHLWWHPHNFGGDVAGNLESLELVLKAFDQLRQAYGAQSYTMSEFADATCP